MFQPNIQPYYITGAHTYVYIKPYGHRYYKLSVIKMVAPPMCLGLSGPWMIAPNKTLPLLLLLLGTSGLTITCIIIIIIIIIIIGHIGPLDDRA